jgi:hypothetical protein
MKPDVLFKAKDAILKIEPSAEIYLFGSRMCNLLVLVEGEVSDDRSRRVSLQLLDIAGNTQGTLSGLVRSRSTWKDLPNKPDPLVKNILREGLQL